MKCGYPPFPRVPLTMVSSIRTREVQAGRGRLAPAESEDTCMFAVRRMGMFFSPGSHEVPHVLLLLARLCLGTLSQFASLGHSHRGQALHSCMAPAHIMGQDRRPVCPGATKSPGRASCFCPNRPIMVTGLVREAGNMQRVGSFSAPLLRIEVSPTSFLLESATLPRHTLSLCQGSRSVRHNTSSEGSENLKVRGGSTAP
jgi:hypothetical protein